MLENAIDMAVNRCIDEHVLSDFLTQYGKEVRGMLYDDISIEDFAQIRGEERWEDGRQYGCEEMQNRINQLNALLIEEGRIEDLKKSTEDKNYQEDLLKEYQLNRK